MAGENKRTSSVGAGSNIRLQQATTRNRSQRHTGLSASSKIAVGFFNFIRSHGVVSLAVGFVIATQAQAVIKQLVASFITPTFQFFFKGSLAKDTATFHINGRTVSYSWGAFINELLTLLFVLLALYLIITIFKLDKIDKKDASS
jgi:large-conductance mechanosensitive channel